MKVAVSSYQCGGRKVGAWSTAARGLAGGALLCVAATTGGAETTVTSRLHEVLVDQVGTQTWLRFRYVVPEIAREGGTVSFTEAEPHMAHLCAAFAVPYTREHALTGDVIVISFADRETEFGVPDPDATQFFEAYRIENDACIWEGL